MTHRMYLSLFTVMLALMIGCAKSTDPASVPEPAVPVVITTAVTAISNTSAVSGGNVTSDAGTAVTVRGVCWGTSPSPTTASTKTTDSSGTGIFISALTGLTENTTYYVRAYATNSSGTGYGASVSFKTSGGSGSGPTSGQRVSGGRGHSLFVLNDSTAMGSGFNAYGQIGDSTTVDRNRVVKVKNIASIVSLAAADEYTIALKKDGSVWTWGRYPTQVAGISDIIAIACGSGHSLALKSDGTVWAWGGNLRGQLGDGTTTARTTPVQVNSLSGITAIAGGFAHSLALKSDGTVWAWGLNQNNQLADGSSTQRNTPVQVQGPGNTGTLSGIVSIAGGGYHSIALKNDGTVWCWGANQYGQIGNNAQFQNVTGPVQVHGPANAGFISGISSIASGTYFTLALKNDGTMWAWGYNDRRQLGDSTATNRLTPIQVHGAGNVGFLTGVTHIAGGDSHTLARKSDGTFWVWGYNGYGQLGNGGLGGVGANGVPEQVTGILP